MWIVRLALRRPYTFVVFALLILILGVFSIETMPTDIFPNIDIPVVTVVWQYAGLSADQIANRIVTNAERGMTTTVNDIDHIESQSLVGVGIIKIFFHPNVNIGQAVAQVGADQPGAVALSAAGDHAALHHSVQRLQRAGAATGALRAGLERSAVERPGHTTPSASNWPRWKARKRRFPFGGKQRQIEVDLDLNALEARGLSPADVVNAIAAQNVIAPVRHHQARPFRVPGGDQLRAFGARMS